MVVTEAVRALAAFALYLLLYPLWGIVGAHDFYESVVLKIGSAVMLGTQHFPVYSTLENFKISYLDFLPIFVLSYFLVSTGVGWGARLRRFGLMAAVVLGLQVLGLILETKGDAAAELQVTEGLMILLPWELVAVDVFKYLLVDFGLNIGPFVVMLLGTAWNAGISFAPRAAPSGAERGPRRKRPRGLAGPDRAPGWWSSVGVTVMALMLSAAAGIWCALRESDPRHVQAHATLGHLFLRDSQPDKAEEQYRIALKHGSTDGQAYYNLAAIQARSGRTGDAVRLLRRGLDTVEDASWRTRMFEEKARLTSGG